MKLGNKTSNTLIKSGRTVMDHSDGKRVVKGA